MKFSRKILAIAISAIALCLPLAAQTAATAPSGTSAPSDAAGAKAAPNGLEVYIAPNLSMYSNALGYSGAIGLSSELGSFIGGEAQPANPLNNLYVAIDGSYEYTPGSNFTFMSGCAYLNLGYAFHILPESLKLRIVPKAGVGGSYVRWSDTDDAGYQGFAFALFPQLMADMPIPGLENLRVGIDGGYRILFINTVFCTPVAGLSLGYQFQ